MKILLQDLGPAAGGQRNYKLLLESLLKEFPEDQYTVICNTNSCYWSLKTYPNIRFLPFHNNVFKEVSRFWLETFRIGRVAKKYEADVIWTVSVGPYIRTGIPQVLLLFNPFQVYPWTVAQYHPRLRLTLAALRWFFRRSLRCCDALQVEMPFMGEYARHIPGAPQWIEAIPKAVESSQDMMLQPLSPELQQQFNSGLGRSAFTFLYVAFPWPHKNQKTVVAAMEILRTRGIAARLVFSATEEQLRRCCNAEQISSLMKSGHLLPLGWIPDEQLFSLYEACDACVMPSHLEQLSSSHLEAMHWKKSQISADLPYAHDLCGDATLYADPNDAADWATKMQMLMENPEQRGRLVAAGLARMMTFPQTWREVARRERAFLAEVVDRYRKVPRG